MPINQKGKKKKKRMPAQERRKESERLTVNELEYECKKDRDRKSEGVPPKGLAPIKKKKDPDDRGGGEGEGLLRKSLGAIEIN